MNFAKEKEGSLMWALVFIIAGLFFWFWLSREQGTDEEAAEDALDAAENIKRKVEIKSEPDPVPAPKAEAPTPKAEVPAPVPAPQAPSPAPATIPQASTPTEPDDLIRIEGIGPKFAEILQAAGVDTFAKLAAMSEDAITETIRAGGGRKSASIGTWAEQAKLAAAGDWDALEQLQASLRGGRKA